MVKVKQTRSWGAKKSRKSGQKHYGSGNFDEKARFFSTFQQILQIGLETVDHTM